MSREALSSPKLSAMRRAELTGVMGSQVEPMKRILVLQTPRERDGRSRKSQMVSDVWMMKGHKQCQSRNVLEWPESFGDRERPTVPLERAVLVDPTGMCELDQGVASSKVIAFNLEEGKLKSTSQRRRHVQEVDKRDQ